MKDVNRVEGRHTEYRVVINFDAKYINMVIIVKLNYR